jgi:hypothetical protein
MMMWQLRHQLQKISLLFYRCQWFQTSSSLHSNPPYLQARPPPPPSYLHSPLLLLLDPVMVRRGAAATAAAAREEEESSPAQRLIEAALIGDAATVEACLLAADQGDVPAASRVGVARLRVRCADVALREEAAGEVVAEAREIRTDVSPLFAAAHAGHAHVVRALLVD